MISIEKWKILTPLQKLPKNVDDLGKITVTKSFKKLPKVQSGHTVCWYQPNIIIYSLNATFQSSFLRTFHSCFY